MMFGSIRRSSARFHQPHLDPLDGRAGGVEDEVLRRRLRAVDLLEQRRDVRGDHVDDAELERLAGAVVRGRPHHCLGGLLVATVLARQLADVRGSIVDHLPPKVLTQVLAGGRDRRRRPDVGLRRHREDVRRLSDHGTGGVGARAGGRDVDHDRDLEREHRLDDLAHRGAEPARRVHLDDDRGGALVRGLLHRVLEELLRDGVDVVVELDHDDVGRVRGLRGRRRHREGEGGCDRRKEGAEHTPERRVHDDSTVSARFRSSGGDVRIS